MPSLNRLVETKAAVEVADMAVAEPESPMTRLGRRAARSLTVPMLKDGDLIGAIGIYRQEVRAIHRQADRAGAELRRPGRHRHREHAAAQRTARIVAAADRDRRMCSKVISRSTFDLQPVFEAVAESAVRLCGADRAFISRFDGELLQLVAACNSPDDFTEFMRRNPIRPGRQSAVGSGRTGAASDPNSGCFGRSGIFLWVQRRRADPNVARSADTEARRPARRDNHLPPGGPSFHATSRSLWSRPSPTKAAIAIENVRLFDEIQDKSRQLAEASQHKSQFLANMSHELRTPLNAILGYNELIVDGIYGTPSEKMQAVLKRVESNGRHLLGLINAVLDLSKIEAGQFTLDLADYSLQNVAQTVYNAVEPLALDKKLVFKAEVQSDLPPGHGDERRLTQVLLNLVGNAIKFTDAGEVVIKADASNGTFNLAVRDTGPGISAADQAKLFQEFQQADNSMTRKKEGTGLGLAISKRIIEMHGGRIWMESQVGRVRPSS